MHGLRQREEIEKKVDPVHVDNVRRLDVSYDSRAKRIALGAKEWETNNRNSIDKPVSGKAIVPFSEHPIQRDDPRPLPARVDLVAGDVLNDVLHPPY